MLQKYLSGYLKTFLVFSLAIFASCEYEFIEPEPVVIPETISFADDIIPIFNSSCNFSGCHVSGFGVLDLSPANAFNDLFRKGMINIDAPDESDLYLKLIESGGTHRGRSTSGEQAIILEWIVKGAQNN